MQELEEQLEVERALKVIADEEDAQQLIDLTRRVAAKRIQQAWKDLKQARADAKSGKKSKKKGGKGGKGGKAGGKKADGGAKASGDKIPAKKAEGKAKGKKK